jgi:MoaA/NifB/PqqE/SkfB family radical SAM enzyme
LCGINGRYGQIRVSLYEDNDWPEIVALLSRCNARFGINWLITPEELKTIESKFSRLLTLGVRDFLLLSYKGNALPQMHLAGPDRRRLADFVNRIHACLDLTVQIKLDICWGDHLSEVPRLFTSGDCEAGDDFLSITSDRDVKPCSFHQTATQFETLDDVRAYWERWCRIRRAASLVGCARLPDHGLTEGGLSQNAVISLATIQ